MLKAWRAWKALSDEQRKIIRQKQVKLHRPIDELLALLQPVADMDKQMTWTGFGVGCTMFLVFVLGMFGSIFLGNMFDSSLPAVLWGLLCAAFFFGPLVIYRATRDVDISNNLRSSALPMLYVLRDDFDPKEPVQLTLDLRQPMSKEKKLREEKVHANTTDTYYNDAWMSAEAVLVDGSRLKWSVAETLRHRSRTKRSSSGKYKTKTKDSHKCSVEVELAVRNKSYAVTGGEAGEKRTTLTSSKTFKLAGSEPVNPKYILEAITDLFLSVSPVK